MGGVLEASFLIGLDYGSESARGVLLDTSSGALVGEATHPYRHGIMTTSPVGSQPLPSGWALQDASDYVEAAETLLAQLGRGRVVTGIGVGFTASSPMPATSAGAPLSSERPEEPHAYVKLWKHHAAQPWAERINARGGRYLANFGGKVSSEWLLPKAAQIAEEAPELWSRTHRFIELGDWIVWQLTGCEVRSADFAAYKAQYSLEHGYPQNVVVDLGDKLTAPIAVGRPAGTLRESWRRRCGILGEPVVAVAVIDLHVTAPAVGATEPGTFVGALGTSAAYLLLDDARRPLPSGIEGVARDGVIPGLWCYEAGQPAFGDVLGWFVREFVGSESVDQSFARFEAQLADRPPGESDLVALDWWNGSRAPLSDSTVSGLLLGLTLKTTPMDVYRALVESLCFGARSIAERLIAGSAPITRVILASGVAEKSPFAMQTMADILGRMVEVPRIRHAAAVGAAIHGAVAAGVAPDFRTGARRYGASDFVLYRPRGSHARSYDRLFKGYSQLVSDPRIRDVMHLIRR